MNKFDKTWEELKKEEKGETTVTDGLERIPQSFTSSYKS